MEMKLLQLELDVRLGKFIEADAIADDVLESLQTKEDAYHVSNIFLHAIQGSDDKRCSAWLKRTINAATRFDMPDIVCQASLALCNQLIEDSDYDNAHIYLASYEENYENKEMKEGSSLFENDQYRITVARMIVSMEASDKVTMSSLFDLMHLMMLKYTRCVTRVSTSSSETYAEIEAVLTALFNTIRKITLEKNGFEIRDDADKKRSLYHWTRSLSFLSSSANSAKFSNLANHIWVKECLARNMNDECLNFIENAAKNETDNLSIQQLGLVISIHAKNQDKIHHYLSKILQNVLSGDDILTTLHFVLKETSEVNQDFLDPVLDILKKEMFYQNESLFVATLKLLMNVDRTDLILPLLDVQFIREMRDLTTEDKYFISKLSFNLGISCKKEEEEEKRFLLFKLSGDLISEQNLKVSLYLSAVAVGLQVLGKKDDSAIYNKVLKLLQFFDQLALPAHVQRVLVTSQVRLFLFSKNRSFSFNLQACLTQLKEYEEVEILEGLAMAFHKQGMNDVAVESLLHCLKTSRVSSNQGLIGVSILEICSLHPHHWPNIFSILKCVRDRIMGQEGPILSYVWNSFIKLSLSSADKVVREEWWKCVAFMYNSIVQQHQLFLRLDELPTRLFPEVYSKILAAIQVAADDGADDQDSQDDDAKTGGDDVGANSLTDDNVQIAENN